MLTGITVEKAMNHMTLRFFCAATIHVIFLQFMYFLICGMEGMTGMQIANAQQYNVK